MSNVQNLIDDETFKRLTKRVAKLTSEYAKGYKAGLHRGHFGSRSKIHGCESHGQCMRRNDSWGRGYEAGFVGSDPKPPKGAPKREHGESRDKQICVRVSEQQLANYNAKGGKDWLIKELS